MFTTMINLALLYVPQRRHTNTKKLYNHVLYSREQLGCGHISVRATKCGLAIVYHLMRRYRQAEPLFK